MYSEFFSMRGPSFERLHVLLLLSQHGSLIKAAKGHSGVQSRYSHRLRELSAFFGVELTTRSGKTLRLTPAGEQLAKITREHFDALLHFRGELRNETRSVRIGGDDSVLQWMAIPAIGSLRRPDRPFKAILESQTPQEIGRRLQEQQLDFGLIEKSVVPRGLKSERVCRVKYVAVVPRRLVSTRGLLTLKKVLLECPHAVLANDAILKDQLEKLAKQVGGKFKPELICDTHAQCIAAVGSGFYAAIVPTRSWDSESNVDCDIVDDPALETLESQIELVWNPRLMDVLGQAGNQIKNDLLSAFKSRATID